MPTKTQCFWYLLHAGLERDCHYSAPWGESACSAAGLSQRDRENGDLGRSTQLSRQGWARSHRHREIFNHGVGKYVRGIVPTTPPRKTMCSSSCRHCLHTACSHATFLVSVCVCACVFVFISQSTPLTGGRFACHPAGQSGSLQVTSNRVRSQQPRTHSRMHACTLLLLLLLRNNTFVQTRLKKINLKQQKRKRWQNETGKMIVWQ